MFAVTGYEISLWLHITAAVLGLGATFTIVLLFQTALKTAPTSMPLVHRVQAAVTRWVANPALVVVLVTGLYQVSDGNWEMGSFWISATFAIVIAIGAINGAYLIRTDKQLGAMAAAEVAAAGSGALQLSPEYLQRVRQEGAIVLVLGALVVVAIFLMVVKPGA